MEGGDYTTAQLGEEETPTTTRNPFTDPLYLSRGPKIEYAMGMCPRSEHYVSRCVVGVSPLMADRDAGDVVAADEKVVWALV